MNLEKTGHSEGRILTEIEKQETLTFFRNSIRNIFEENSLPLQQLFLVSALMSHVGNVNNTNLYEFPKFKNSLINDLPTEEKKNALLVALFASDKEAIKKKCDFLRKRIQKVSILSGVGGAIPIPGSSMLVDIGILSEEVYFYVETLRLSRVSLETFSNSFGITYDDLERDVLGRSSFFNPLLEFLRVTSIHGLKLLSYFLLKHLPQFLISNGFEEYLKTALLLLIPGFGIGLASLSGGFISYFTTYSCLNRVLNEFETMLIKVHDYCRENRRI